MNLLFIAYLYCGGILKFNKSENIMHLITLKTFFAFVLSPERNLMKPKTDSIAFDVAFPGITNINVWK